MTRGVFCDKIKSVSSGIQDRIPLVVRYTLSPVNGEALCKWGRTELAQNATPLRETFATYNVYHEGRAEIRTTVFSDCRRGIMIDQAWKVLSDREADILRLREQRVTLREIAEKYGISDNRARQIAVDAKRKLRDEQRKILAAQANQMLVTSEFSRSDLILLRKALMALREQRSSTITHTLGNMKDLMDNDPIYQKAESLMAAIDELLKATMDNVRAYIDEGLQELEK